MISEAVLEANFRLKRTSELTRKTNKALPTFTGKALDTKIRMMRISLMASEQGRP